MYAHVAIRMQLMYYIIMIIFVYVLMYIEKLKDLDENLEDDVKKSLNKLLRRVCSSLHLSSMQMLTTADSQGC